MIEGQQSARAEQVLREIFGYEHFRGHQSEVIAHLCAGGDALVLMPTGGGKSLCYQLPALVREGVGVVVSPLIALMQDQVEALRQNGVRAAFLNSALSQEEACQVENQVAANALDLLYVAPERLLMPRTLRLLANSRLALFAIDEAHCVSQWGHDFRPEYIRLSVLHERFPDVPRIALTATADAQTRNEIIERLGLSQARVFSSGFDRPNIHYRIAEESGDARQDLLEFIRAEHADESGIVYCLSRKRVESVAEWLCARGLNALPYHAGMSAEQRHGNQSRFLREDGLIMVATIAFGMGIDKPDVRFVAHLNLPRSLEAYYQETGRAGRDGRAADAWMRYSLQDVVTLNQMQASTEAGETRKQLERHKLDALLGLCEVTSCRRAVLLRYLGDPYEPPCGNCDNCLAPPQTWDATVIAQKALSCVHRTGQRFGVTHVIDVLLGRGGKRMQALGHENLSTYGIGTELHATEWRSVFRQLISRGLLTIDLQGHGILQLTEASRPILRGDTRLFLRVTRKTPTHSARMQVAKSVFTDTGDRRLWEALRALRKRLSEAQSVPAYVIIHDATLREMVTARPITRAQLGRLGGIGKHKLDAYGDAFLELIRSHEANKGKGADSAHETMVLFHAGMSASSIAEYRNLGLSTIYAHLADAVARGEIELGEAVGLDGAHIELIRQAIHEHGGHHMKPVYQQLMGRYDYGILRCVRAQMTSIKSG